jgi:hypothetical protein
MTRGWMSGGAALLLAAAVCAGAAQRVEDRTSSQERNYLGFDRNDYPGDAALPGLRKSFRFTSYWLNPPPGETQNSWVGKRVILHKHGFGFLVLFNGHTDAELKAAEAKGQEAAMLGAADGKDAVAAALREGFSLDVLIFLDQEEGGRLLPEQATYLFAWVDAVRGAGARAGVYCSGIVVREGTGTISTAEDIAERESTRMLADHSAKSANRGSRLALWLANDQCPPAPGCSLAAPPLSAALSPAIAAFTSVWQYAQSPRRAQFSASCPANQAPDGNCYAPGLPANAGIFVDLDTANSPDPSEAPKE